MNINNFSLNINESYQYGFAETQYYHQINMDTFRGVL